MVKVEWKFKNDHTWTRTFESHEEAVTFINICALVSHPDITQVKLDGDILKQPVQTPTGNWIEP